MWKKVTFLFTSLGVGFALALGQNSISNLSGDWLVLAWVFAVLLILTWPLYFIIKSLMSKKQEELRPPKFLWNWKFKFQFDRWFPFNFLISLKDGTQEVYEKTLETIAAGSAERTAEDIENSSINSWYASVFVGSGNRISLYGYRFGTKRFEKIPPKTFNQGGFSKDVNSFALYGKKHPIYVGLTMKRSDVRKMVKMLKSWDDNQVDS